MTLDKFRHAIECLRSTDSLLYDQGYHTLQGEFLRRHLDAVIELYTKEGNPVLRGRFIELLGDSKEPRVIPLLESELTSDEIEVRRWALHALDYFPSPEAQAIAKLHRTQYPEDAQ